MGIHTKLLGLISGALLGGSVWAAQWFTVASPSLEPAPGIVEIDLETVRTLSTGGEAVIRVTSEAAQSHTAGFTYRSFVATAHFDCSQRSITLSSAAYFALPSGQGARLGADSSGRQAGMPSRLLESIPLAARQALLKAACATTHVN